MLTDLFLIRHAAPEWHGGPAYRTAPGPNLSVGGQREAQQLAHFLADKALDHLFVSPFARTMQTATLIVERLGVPVTVTRLIEENALTESAEQVHVRIRDFLHSLTDSLFRRVGIVSHGYPIRMILEELSRGRLDLRPYVFDNNNPAPTAGVWQAHRVDDGWRLDLVFQPNG